MTEQKDSSQPISKQKYLLDDMIMHDVLLERYSWLTPQIIHRWRRSGAIRAFRGRDGKFVYPLGDITKAFNSELKFLD